MPWEIQGHVGTDSPLPQQRPGWSETAVRRQRCTGLEYAKMVAQEVVAEAGVARKLEQVARRVPVD